MIHALLSAGGPRLTVSATGLAVLPPPAKPKRRRRTAVPTDDGHMLMTLSQIGRTFSLKKPELSFNLAARRGWDVDFDGTKGVFRVPLDYIHRRADTKTWGRHSKRKPAKKPDLFNGPTA